MEYGCKGKNVCITGGTSGIGLAVARTLLREGARALVIGREAAKGARVEQELLQMADGELYIPMYGMIQSFNVSVAAAIILSSSSVLALPILS